MIAKKNSREKIEFAIKEGEIFLQQAEVSPLKVTPNNPT